jgi:glucose-fructose oxidoreductase
MTVTVDGKAKNTKFPDCDQIAPEIVYFSDCVLRGRRPEPDGREGLIDLWIIEAIKASAMKGKAVPLQPLPEKPRPDRGQHIAKPKKKSEPDLVKAAPPQAG